MLTAHDVKPGTARVPKTRSGSTATVSVYTDPAGISRKQTQYRFLVPDSILDMNKDNLSDSETTQTHFRFANAQGCKNQPNCCSNGAKCCHAPGSRGSEGEQDRVMHCVSCRVAKYHRPYQTPKTHFGEKPKTAKISKLWIV